MPSSRTLTLLKQLRISLLYKVLAMFLSFYAVRVSLDYLGVANFGVWAVVLSILNWVVFFDFGIANGVKNKVSISRAENNIQNVRAYISTGYISIFMFCAVSYSVFYIAASHINWQVVFGNEIYSTLYYSVLVKVAAFFILFNFGLTLITQIANAYQQSSLTVLSQLIGVAVSVLLLVSITKWYEADLINMAIIYGVSISLGNLAITLKFFRKHKNIKPRIKYFSVSNVRSIFKLGGKFFSLQLIVFFMLSTDKMLIAHLINTETVSNYEVVYKYFTVLLVFHSLINAPLWPIYTEAYHKKDFEWLLQAIKKLDLLIIIYCLMVLLMSAVGGHIFRLWLGDNGITPNFLNLLSMGAMVVMFLFYTTYAYISNGLEKTKIQLYAGLVGAVINIPLTIFLVKTCEMEVNGVVIATLLSLSVFAVSARVFIVRDVRNEYRLHLQEEERRLTVETTGLP